MNAQPAITPANLKYQPPETELNAIRRAEASGDVIIVHEEWEEGGDGGHSIPLGLFWRVEDALRCYSESVARNKNEYGRIVYGHCGEDEESDWEVEVHIDAMPVQVRPFVTKKDSNNPGRLLWETFGQQVEVTAIAVGVLEANAFMVKHEKLSVINEIGPVVLLAKVDDLGTKALAVGRPVTRG